MFRSCCRAAFAVLQIRQASSYPRLWLLFKGQLWILCNLFIWHSICQHFQSTLDVPLPNSFISHFFHSSAHSCQLLLRFIFRHWSTRILLPRTSYHNPIFFTSQRHLQILRYYKGLSPARTPILQKQNPRTERSSILCGGTLALWFPSGQLSIF